MTSHTEFRIGPSERISEAVFWRIRNRLITIVKMLTSLLNR
jgi:hypothetical protein